jgi:PadR family transcriptional regulator PadR
MPRRPSAQTIAVLAALAADPEQWRYGYDLGRQVDLKAGSLYPILMRLHDQGMLDSSWESDPPPGRPSRHLYRLTAAGVRLAVETAPAGRAPAADRTAAEPTVGSRQRRQPRNA